MSCLQILGRSREGLSCVMALSPRGALEQSSCVRQNMTRTEDWPPCRMLACEIGALGDREMRGSQGHGLCPGLASRLLAVSFVSAWRSSSARVPQSQKGHSFPEVLLASRGHTAADKSCRCSRSRVPLLGQEGAGCGALLGVL